MAYDLAVIYDAIVKALETSPTTSLEQLQALLVMDRHILLKAVKVQSGQTFRELKSVILLNYVSHRLLQSPPPSLKEISFGMGYSSQRSLSRFIRARLGISPKQLRHIYSGTQNTQLS